MGTDHNFGEFTASDLETLHAVVRRRSNRLLTHEDVEDIASKILEDAVRGSLKTGTPLVKLAFTYSQYASYYTRPLDTVMDDLRRGAPLVYDEAGYLTEENDAADECVDFSECITEEFLSQLPDDELAAFRALMIDASASEVAVVAEVPSSTLHNRVRRARTRLEHLLAA